MDLPFMLPKNLVPCTWALFAFVLGSLTFAAPLHNATTQATVSNSETSLGPMTFGPEPRGRGTWGILFSCTTTFVFCVWTAVHPNVIPNVPDNYRLCYKGVLMAISIINPEGIAVFAYGQFTAARKLKKQWDNHVEAQEWSERLKAKDSRKCSFDMAVAFFIVMGGFTIDVSDEMSDRHVNSKHIKRLKDLGIIPDEDRAERSNSRYTATLTPLGFEKYLKDGYFENDGFKEHSLAIRDKAKASNIAKTLAATQALWLAVDCAARKADGLPLRYSYQVPRMSYSDMRAVY